MKPVTRRKRARGRWMKLRDRGLLVGYMAARDFSQARLGRFAGTSRQFIHMLTSGEKDTCTPKVARRIEEALSVLPGTLFVARESPTARPTVVQSKTRGAA